MAEFLRSFLFLGAVSPSLAPALASALRDAGHRASLARRAASVGDWAGDGNREDWSDWVQQKLVDQDVTDLCVSSDGGQLAEKAALVASQLGLRVWRLGPGYFGRGWITCTAAEFPLDLSVIQRDWSEGPVVDPSRIARQSQSFRDKFRTLLPRRQQTRYGPRRLSKGAPYTLIMSREGQSREGAEQLYRFAITTAARHADLNRNLVIRLWPEQPSARAMNRSLRSLVRRAGLKGQVTFTREETPALLVRGAESVVTSSPPIAALALARQRPILPMSLPFEVSERTSPDLAAFWSARETDTSDLSEALLRCLATMQVSGHLDARADREALVERLTARMLDAADEERRHGYVRADVAPEKGTTDHVAEDAVMQDEDGTRNIA